MDLPSHCSPTLKHQSTYPALCLCSQVRAWYSKMMGMMSAEMSIKPGLHCLLMIWLMTWKRADMCGKFKRNRVYVPKIDYQWHAELMDMTQISASNNGVMFVLLVIDIFSRYMWTAPLKTKQGSEVTKVFETIFAERKIKYMKKDKGGEFTGGSNLLQTTRCASFCDTK